MKKLPNILTILRIIMIPIFILIFYIDIPYQYYIAAGIFLLAFLTDILDGHLARKYQVVSDFGKLADPIADKMLVTAALLMMVFHWMISPIVAIIILCREFIISGFRSLAASKGLVISAGVLGKIKTVVQCIAIIAVLMGNIGFQQLGIPFDKIMVIAAVIMTVWSGIDYIVRNRNILKSDFKQN